MVDIDRIKEGLEGYIEAGMKKQNIPGLAISIVGRDGILWSEGFGYTDRTKQREIDSKTLFSIQSTGKTLTAVSFLRAVQKGWVGLDDKLLDHYPEFTIKSRFDTDEVSKITFRHLLSHKAGLTHEAPLGSNYDMGDCTFEEHIESISDTWLRSRVGTEYSYSNLGFDLVAYVLQRKSGKSFPEYVNEELAEPLGIDKLFYDKEEAIAYGNTAVGFSGNFETKFKNMMIYGAGCQYMSVDGLLQYVKMQLNNGLVNEDTFLEKDLLDEMRTVQMPAERQEGGYGLGLGYNPYMFQGVDIYHHGGGGFGFLGMMMWAQEEGYGVIVETNQEVYNSLFMDLTVKALKMVLEESGVEIKQGKNRIFDDKAEIDLSIDVLKKYQGSYICDTLEMNIKLEDKKLKGDVDGMEFALTPIGDGRFTTDKPPGMKFFLDGGKPEYVEYMNSEGNIYYFYYQDISKDRIYDTKNLEDKLKLYRGYMYGNPFFTALKIEEGNLVLYFHGCKCILNEYRPNLFFTAHGESFELKEDKMIFRNIEHRGYDFRMDKADMNNDENRLTYPPSMYDLAGALKFLGDKRHERVKELADELNKKYMGHD
ncbi:MAG: serine hydrolase domain-containing protein [Candidatus Saliniplasma sp.]